MPPFLEILHFLSVVNCQLSAGKRSQETYRVTGAAWKPVSTKVALDRARWKISNLSFFLLLSSHRSSSLKIHALHPKKANPLPSFLLITKVLRVGGESNPVRFGKPQNPAPVPALAPAGPAT